MYTSAYKKYISQLVQRVHKHIRFDMWIYIDIHECIHVCMSINVYICVCIQLTYIYVCVHTTKLYVCIHVYLYKIVCIQIRNSLNVYILMPAWIHGVIQDSLNVHTHIRFCIYIYMCIYIYTSIVESMYVYIHTCTHS